MSDNFVTLLIYNNRLFDSVSYYALASCSAEVLDKHLSMVQSDHEQKSQILERRIKDDAAVEEAKRREQSMKDEKIKQERTRQEAEVCLLRFVIK
jgi:hypothetical protein